MSKTEIKAIFFDIDDTLYATSQFAKQAHWSAVKAMVDAGVKMSCEDLFRELKEVIEEFSSNYSRHFDKLLVRIPLGVHSHINSSVLIASAVIAYHDTKHAMLQVYPDALRLLKQLANRKVARGIITAGLAIKQAEKLLRLGIYPYLTPEAIFISEQIGISKPNPKIYRYACARLKLNPGQTVYLGDKPTHDIDPPNEIGMITVRVRKGGKHDNTCGKSVADYEIDDFDSLVSLLERDYILP